MTLFIILLKLALIYSFEIDSYSKTLKPGHFFKIKIKTEKSDLLPIKTTLKINTNTQTFKKIKWILSNQNRTLKYYIPLKFNEEMVARVTFSMSHNEIKSKLFSKTIPIKTIEIHINSDEVQFFQYQSTYSFLSPLPNPRTLVIVLHGYLGNGSDFIHAWKDAAYRYQMAIASLSAIDSSQWQITDWLLIQKMIETIQLKYPFIQDQIFITGVSAGAVASYLYGLTNPHTFKALGAISGIPKYESEFQIDPTQIPLASDKENQIPIINILGKKDPYFFSDATDHHQLWINHLRSYGYHVKDIVHPNMAHELRTKDTYKVFKYFQKIID